ncbi:hypothetical protein BV25DRAFT_702614 [Artomyces pyxidatus]|uniref:Uncharacterized protein n=1 Tax=Artomyces pyxidatus TaxID=48021 RepID=A0ACB8T1B3_9AGAM|nr:hypothetical protein BV25DRAFT_702614 [Artomyces pyxidatus]
MSDDTTVVGSDDAYMGCDSAGNATVSSHSDVSLDAFDTTSRSLSPVSDDALRLPADMGVSMERATSGYAENTVYSYSSTLSHAYTLPHDDTDILLTTDSLGFEPFDALDALEPYPSLNSTGLGRTKSDAPEALQRCAEDEEALTWPCRCVLCVPPPGGGALRSARCTVCGRLIRFSKHTDQAIRLPSEEEVNSNLGLILAAMDLVVGGTPAHSVKV